MKAKHSAPILTRWIGVAAVAVSLTLGSCQAEPPKPNNGRTEIETPRPLKPADIVPWHGCPSATASWSEADGSVWGGVEGAGGIPQGFEPVDSVWCEVEIEPGTDIRDVELQDSTPVREHVSTTVQPIIEAVRKLDIVTPLSEDAQCDAFRAARYPVVFLRDDNDRAIRVQWPTERMEGCEPASIANLDELVRDVFAR